MPRIHGTTKKNTVTIPLRLSREATQKLDLLVKRLHAKSRNELIREAIHQFTELMMSTKIVEVRNVSVEEAAKLMDDYISRHPGKHYVSDLSEEFGIELGTAFEASQKLIDSRATKKRKV